MYFFYILGLFVVYIFFEDRNIKIEFYDDFLEIFLRRGGKKWEIVCLVDVDLLLNIMWYELLCYGMKDMVIGYLGEKGNIVIMIDEFLKLGDSY